MRKTWRTWLWMLLSCAAMGAIPAAIEFAFRNVSLRHAAYSALDGFVYASCIGIPCWFLVPRAACRLNRHSPPTRFAAMAGLLAAFGVAGCFLANVILIGIGLVDAGAFAATWWWSLKVCLMITFSFGAVSLAISILHGRLEEAKRELQRREIAQERERKLTAEARFASLESRIHPHFLFNTLNSISALVREDPAAAERTIERLSALIRFSLDADHAGLVTLREELAVVRDYLEIEKVRFGARLRYRIDCSEMAGAHLLPALSIQTLAENSVKYAVGARREGAEIIVSARVHDGRLRVEVQDDGPGFEPASSRKPGHGLDLLERRLASLFGSGASLEMSASEGRTLVAISLAS